MKLKDNPKAYAIMGCAMRVHDALGPGFLESAYGDALEIEFANAGIPFVREDEVRVFYNGQPLKTTYRADFTCYGREFIVELKAVKSITKIEWAQVIHYMRATRVKNAFLINFGRGRIQYETFDLDRLPDISSPDASCAVNAEFDARSASIQRSGSESTTARSFCQNAAGNLTPMIDAPATAPLANLRFACSSPFSIVSSESSKENGFPVNPNLKDVSCSVNAEWKSRRKTIQRSGSESNTARSFSDRLTGNESTTARSFSNRRTGIENNTTRSLI